MLLLFGQSHQLDYGLLSSGDDDLLPPASFFDEAGKLRLGFVNGDGFHVVMMLAKIG